VFVCGAHVGRRDGLVALRTSRSTSGLPVMLRRRRGPGSVPTEIRVEYVTGNESGPNPAGDRLQFACADKAANGVLGAAELGGNLAHGQGSGPLHTWNSAATLPSSSGPGFESCLMRGIGRSRRRARSLARRNGRFPR
jgi:hypothetical protein